MKIVTYNIQYGKGKDDVVDLSRIIDEVNDAEIIALQEVERFWPRTGNVDQVKIFADHFNDYYWSYSPGVDIHLPESSPQDNRRRQFGNMVLSKFPIEQVRNHLLPKYSSLEDLSIQRTALEATINLGDQLLRIYSIHLTHLSSTTRLAQIERILDIHRNAAFEGYAISGNVKGMDWESGIDQQEVTRNALLMGDFNLQPDSEEYNRLAGPISSYGGHISNHEGFVDAWCFCGGEKMAGETSDVKDIPARLDYCFASTEIRQQLKKCWVDSAATGSDHSPVWVEFELK
jgi:endonuclease/exonuclease/phosphatase family metal-dependent hydrolase